MTINLQARSGFEGAARLAKVLRLVSVIDENTPPGATPSGVADVLESWRPSDWARAAVCAGVYPPSRTTQAVVVGYYRGRAARVRREGGPTP